jgi:signal transduction histidine kinase
LVRELDTILDSMVDGILVVDQHDRLATANQVAQVMLGGRLVGRSVEEVCDDPRWFKTYQIVRAAAQLGDGVPGSELTSATTPLIVAQRMLRASFRVKSTPDNGPGGIVVVLRDISAEREAQRAKDSFVESVSQELRTPVTSIIGYADLLSGESVGPLSQPQQRFLERIRANAERVGMQLNDLLGMMAVDSRQLEIRAEVMDLVSVIHEASDALRPQIGEKGQVLEMNLEPNLPYVRADPDAMYHVLRNLLQNAHRCSPEGAHIVLNSRRVSDGEERYVLVSVTDAGGGIAPQYHKKVFNRFYRSDNTVVPGLGDPEISLPVVKTRVEAHGGRGWLDSVEGEGSTFTVLLPVRYRIAEAAGLQTI